MDQSNEKEIAKKKAAKEYNQAYYAKNKKNWLQKMLCDVCNIEVCNVSFQKHLNSKHHLRLIQKLQSSEQTWVPVEVESSCSSSASPSP
jgi:hypothetical protein